LRKLTTLFSLALCLAGVSAGAQSATHVEAGGARVRYNDSVSTTSATLSAGGSLLTPRASASGIVAASTAQSSWTAFGAADGSLFPLARGPVRGELHGGGSLTAHGEGPGSARVLGGARLHLMRRSGGAWVGASVGGARDPIGWRPVTAGEIGAWLRLGAADVQALAMPVRIGGDVAYTDVEATARMATARSEVLAAAGVRTATKGFEESSGAWASVNGIAWVLPHVGITGGVGRYPSDPGQDLPAAAYASLGVRLTGRSARRPASVLPSDVLAAPGPGAAALSVSGVASGARRIALRAPGARTVEIMGDFTDWSPVAMTRGDGGSWVVSLPVSSGVHQVNVRMDGGEWMVPAGLTAVRDEFGGSVGIVVVP
jgi:hypothetical protein